MPAPLLLLVLGGAAVLVAATSTKKTESAPGAGPPDPTPPGGLRTYLLDSDLPVSLRTQVLSALTNGADAVQVEAFAQAIGEKFPLSAEALKIKASSMRARWPGRWPDLSSLAQRTVPSPASGPTAVALSASASPEPEVQTPTVPVSQTQVVPVATTAPSQSATQPAPVSSAPVLDPNMPNELQRAVVGMLGYEYDPAKLAGFASALQGQYPVSSALLLAAAQTRGLAGPPQASAWPQGGGHEAQAPTHSPVVPDHDRNHGRPTGYPFIVLRGESTYPAMIAAQATGSDANYPAMTKLNPQFAPDGVHWMNIQKGDELNIPWDWAPKLRTLYRIQVDAGVSPPADVIRNAVVATPPRSAPPAPVAQTAPAAEAPTHAPVAGVNAPPPDESAWPAPTDAGVSSAAPVPAAAAPTQQSPAVAAPPPAAAHPLGLPQNGVFVSYGQPANGPTYKVVAGDGPIKIAQKVIGDGSKWHELVAANPSKKVAATTGNFVSLQPGEVLQLPLSWSSALLAHQQGATHVAHA